MLKRKPSKVGRPKELSGIGKPIMLYLDGDRVGDFKRMCQDEYGISLSEGIRQLMDQELEKNAVGQSNPIAVNYDFSAKRSIGYNTLDYYLDNGFVTKQYWRKELENHPNEKLEKLEAFGLTITETCRQVKHFKNTGRYLA
jgi:hypothetical protein